MILTALTSRIWAKGEPDAGSQACGCDGDAASTTRCVPVTKAESSLAGTGRLGRVPRQAGLGDRLGSGEK